MLLIIAGQQRSGTSLLRDLCISHPQVSLTNEFGNFRHLGTPYCDYAKFILRRWWKKGNYPLLPPRRDWKGMDMLRNLGFVIHYLARIRRNKEGKIDLISLESSMKGIFRNSIVVGDKYPDYASELDVLTRTNGLDCLYIHRDVRDVVSSTLIKARGEWRKWWPKEYQSAVSVAWRWVKLIEDMERYEKMIHIIRYEELVTAPQEVLHDLGELLQLEPDDFNYQIVHAKSVGNYRKGLTDQELSEVLEVAGPTMLRLGYRI